MSADVEPSGSRGSDRPRIRLGFYSHASRIGGAETYLRDLAKAMDPETFEVHVFIPPWPELVEFLSLADAPGVHQHIVRVVEPATAFPADGSRETADTEPPSFGTESAPSRIRRAALALHLPPGALRTGHDVLRYLSIPVNRPRLAAALAPHRLDVLHVVNGGYPGAASALAAVLAGRTTVRRRLMTVCSTAMPRSILAPVEQVVDRRLAGCLDAVITPAERPALALRRRGFGAGLIATIPWGARSVPPRSDPGARGRLNLADADPVLVCLANFTPTKGQTTLVDALASLVDDFPRIHLVLAGDGPHLPAVRERVRSRGVVDRVSFPGAFTEPWDLLRAADMFVLASEIEGLPLVVLEAMSQGVPVVGTDVGGMPDAVIDGHTGLLVPPRDADALAAAVRRLARDPAAARRMGDAARALFERRFTMAAMFEAHRELYTRLARAA